MYKIISIFFACSAFFTPGFGQTVIKGNFTSLPSSEFRVVFNQSILNEFQGEILAEGKTNATGGFSASFQLNTEQPVLLISSNQFFRLWLIPNTALTIAETGNNKLVFSGQAAKQNNFLYQSGIMCPMFVPPAITSASFEPQRQLQYLDSIEQKRWALFKNDIDPVSVSEGFTSYCSGEILNFSTFNKNQYLLQNIYGRLKIKATDIPPGYYNFWDHFQILDDSCTSDSYRNSLSDYTGYLTSRRLNIFNNIPDKESYFKLEFKILDSLLSARPFTREKLKAEKLIFLLTYFDLPQVVQPGVESFSKEFPGTAYLTLVQQKQDKKKRSSFTTADFALKDISGRLFDIKSLRGKVVYIDFWGGWCTACLAQMPASLKLQQRFKDKDAVFLFIDFYDTEQKWLSAIKNKNLSGIHIKAEKENHQYFNEVFGISEMGFPRYALLDKKGVLITSSAPPPDDKDAISLINKYLE